MHRWLAILLLTLLPFQFSWAAVGAYCGYESDTQAQHVGHHDHQVAGVDGHGDSSAHDASAGQQLECSDCHAGCCSLPEAPRHLTALAVAMQAFTPDDGMVRTLAQNPPERPQWLRLA